MVQDEIGPPPMETRAQLYTLFRELSVYGQMGMELTLTGPGQDLERARRKLAEIKAKLGAVS